MSAAAEWLAAELTSLRIPARVLTAAQIRAADEALLAGIEPAGLRPGWGRLRHAGGYVQTYWMSPGDISSATIDRLWAPDTDATVVSVQLRRTDNGATTVGVMVRYHTGGPLAEPPLTGLNPLSGRHDAGAARRAAGRRRGGWRCRRASWRLTTSGRADRGHGHHRRHDCQRAPAAGRSG